MRIKKKNAHIVQGKTLAQKHPKKTFNLHLGMIPRLKNVSLVSEELPWPKTSLKRLGEEAVFQMLNFQQQNHKAFKKTKKYNPSKGRK